MGQKQLLGIKEVNRAASISSSLPEKSRLKYEHIPIQISKIGKKRFVWGRWGSRKLRLC